VKGWDPSTAVSHPPGTVVRVFVLGIDPGLTRCGYSVVEGHGRHARALALGVLTTPASDPLPTRLADLQRDIRALLVEFTPEVVAVERVLFQVNVRTAMSVGQASGIAMAEAAAAGCDVVQYSPNEVKQAVAGYGGASKEQVQVMVQTLLGLAVLPQPPDAADAAALALTHLAMATSPAVTHGREPVRRDASGGPADPPAPRAGAGQVKNAVGRAPRPAPSIPGAQR
jgi:crossover junction endodeoxyribonuclease RuvC